MIDARMNMIRLRGGYIGHLPSSSGPYNSTFLMCSLAGVTTGFDIVRQHNGVPQITATGGHRPGTIHKSFVSTTVLLLSDAWASLFSWIVIDVSDVWIQQ